MSFYYQIHSFFFFIPSIELCMIQISSQKNDLCLFLSLINAFYSIVIRITYILHDYDYSLIIKDFLNKKDSFLWQFFHFLSDIGMILSTYYFDYLLVSNLAISIVRIVEICITFPY